MKYHKFQQVICFLSLFMYCASVLSCQNQKKNFPVVTSALEATGSRILPLEDKVGFLSAEACDKNSSETGFLKIWEHARYIKTKASIYLLPVYSQEDSLMSQVNLIHQLFNADPNSIDLGDLCTHNLPSDPLLPLKILSKQNKGTFQFVSESLEVSPSGADDLLLTQYFKLNEKSIVINYEFSISTSVSRIKITGDDIELVSFELGNNSNTNALKYEQNQHSFELKSPTGFASINWPSTESGLQLNPNSSTPQLSIQNSGFQAQFTITPSSQKSGVFENESNVNKQTISTIQREENIFRERKTGIGLYFPNLKPELRERLIKMNAKHDSLSFFAEYSEFGSETDFDESNAIVCPSKYNSDSSWNAVTQLLPPKELIDIANCERYIPNFGK